MTKWERAEKRAKRWIPDWVDDRGMKLLYAKGAWVAGYEAAQRDARRKKRK